MQLYSSKLGEAPLGMFLELAGYQVQVVHIAQAAVALALEGGVVDACLLDIGLPDMDGNELARKLRSFLPSTSGAMLIAITGYGQESDRRTTQASGFDHHYVKRVDMERLLDTLAVRPLGAAPPGLLN